MPTPRAPTTIGSSPLARGLPRGGIPNGRGPGIIPARAGFTRERRQQYRHFQDHPRSRGVYKSCVHLSFTVAGSSPLARGLRALWNEQYDIEGIIPARAGFTVVTAPVTGGDGDHPRSRGVYGSIWINIYAQIGSSPLARGLLTIEFPYTWKSGIIPARAGFTATLAQVEASGKDHPRSRGVYEHGHYFIAVCYGSSPLARGLPPRWR